MTVSGSAFSCKLRYIVTCTRIRTQSYIISLVSVKPNKKMFHIQFAWNHPVAHRTLLRADFLIKIVVNNIQRPFGYLMPLMLPSVRPALVQVSGNCLASSWRGILLSSSSVTHAFFRYWLRPVTSSSVSTAARGQTAVTADFSGEQLPLFARASRGPYKGKEQTVAAIEKTVTPVCLCVSELTRRQTTATACVSSEKLPLFVIALHFPYISIQV